jgi:hypothetical protein
MKALTMLNSKKKTIVFNSIDLNLKFWIQFKFNYVTFNSNFVMRIHSILNHWNGSRFFYKIHSSFSSIHHQSWCTSTWSPSCTISKNYVENFENKWKFKEPNFVKENEKLITTTFFNNKENLESSKLIKLFYLIDYWIDMWSKCWNLKLELKQFDSIQPNSTQLWSYMVFSLVALHNINWKA